MYGRYHCLANWIPIDNPFLNCTFQLGVTDYITEFCPMRQNEKSAGCDFWDNFYFLNKKRWIYPFVLVPFLLPKIQMWFPEKQSSSAHE